MSIGTMLGMAALGILGGIVGNKGSQQGSPDYSAMQSQMAQPAAQAPTAPQAPEIAKESPTAQAMDKSAEEEKAAILARQKQNNDVLTSGLGASGLASLQKSHLLGA